VGAGLLVGSGIGPAATEDAKPLGAPIAGRPFVDPPERVSKDGLLTTRLTARPQVTEIAGRRVVSGACEASVASPTLRVRGGDEPRVLQVNRQRGEPTNLHTQVFAGMAGALSVEGAIDRLAGIRNLRERRGPRATGR